MFERGLDKPAGHVLPVQRAANGRTLAQRRFLRSERCYLLPGDSPMGLRLPLDSLPWAAPSERPVLHAPDPMQRFPDLPSRPQVQFQSKDRLRPGPPEPPAQVIRTALCAEPRKGVLYIFMPPVEALEDYLELVSAVEATAAELDIPVLLEGYEPPRDARLESFRITPDPGVLEVNIHPRGELATRRSPPSCTSRRANAAWEPRSSCSTAAIAAPAAATTSRSAGRAPPDSPFLRRPDPGEPDRVLAQPSLALVPFLGPVHSPTSRIRASKARNDSVYEIERSGELEEKTASQCGPGSSIASSGIC